MRSLISIPAGLRRMPLAPFTVYTVIGSLIWNTTLVVAGHALGDDWRAAAGPVEVLQRGVLAVVLIGLAWYVWRRLVQPRLVGATDEG